MIAINFTDQKYCSNMNNVACKMDFVMG